MPIFSPAVVSLDCFRCGRSYPPDPLAYLCPACGDGGRGDPGVLDVKYDYAACRSAFQEDRQAPRRRDAFRFTSLLPLAPDSLLLSAGGTPLISAPLLARRFGLGALYLKDETRNPSRCLKDRATALGVAMAGAAGRSVLYCASAGNAAISLAAFCAHQGLECHVFVPADVSQVRLDWLRRYGAQVTVADVNYDRAYELAETAGAAHGWYSRNCAYNPFLVEGKKTVAFEIAEANGWTAPDLVVAPVGDGCTLGAIGKGFTELRALGVTERLPRLVGVQSEAIQPLVRRSRGETPLTSHGGTRAASIAVRRPRNALRLLEQLRMSEGTMVAVRDEEIEESQRLLSLEAGIVAEFTSAATLAGLARVVGGTRPAGLTAVLVITGGRLD